MVLMVQVPCHCVFKAELWFLLYQFLVIVFLGQTCGSDCASSLSLCFFFMADLWF